MTSKSDMTAQDNGRSQTTAAARLLDAAIEATVLLSFSRIGPLLRRTMMSWRDPAPEALRGKRVVLTGGTSGIGRAAAEQMGKLGAGMVIVGRDPRRGSAVVAALPTGPLAHRFILGDLTDLADVRRVADELLADGPVDVLVHNAGAMFSTLQRSAQGIERTLAVHVIAPFLLTSLCLPVLRETHGRVIVVTSGGMYTEPLNVDALHNPPTPYSGARAYACAKRAQVSLVDMVSPRLSDDGVEIVAMHPGWADTPGLRASLPGFHRVMRPLLRSADEGADTITWLATVPEETLRNGILWLDRAPRPVHRLRRTRIADTAAARADLWALCLELSGVGHAAEQCHTQGSIL